MIWSSKVILNIPAVGWSRRLFLSPAVVLALCLQTSQAQSQERKETRKARDEVVTLKAHLVSTDVMVKDKKGRYITDLKAEDFTVFENGMQQRIEFFDPPLAGVSETGQPNVAGQAGRTTLAGRPSNTISLVFDGQTTELTNLKQVREGTLKYVRERIADTDTVAVFAVTNGLQLLQSFTRDKAKLITAIERAYAVSTSSKNQERNDIAEEIARRREEIRDSEGSADPETQLRAMIASRALQQFIKLRSQLNTQTGRPILAALAAICGAQRAIPGKKTLVLFSQGFVAASILDWQVQATIDIANLANVAVYVIDSAGLAAGAPQSGSVVPASPLQGVSATVSTGDRMRATGGENVFDNARYEGLNREQDVLYRISGDTGGEFIKGTNDIAQGLDRVDQEIRARYTLAYYPTDPNFDGSFRKLKVEVRRSEAHVVSRAGYYANATEDIVPLSAEDRKLLANLATAEANPAFSLFVELSPFRSQEGNYIVPMSIEVPPGAVKFDRRGDKRLMQLEVLGVIRDTPNKILSRLGGNFNIDLTADQYQLVLNNNIFYRQDLELAPGEYDVELIVRDRLSGKMAARRERVVLPVADAEFSTSAIVLSRHALPVKKTPGAAVPDDVLSHGGAQIRPSPSREFRAADNLIVFFDLYNAATSSGTGRPQVKVTVTLMRDNKPAMKPIEYTLTDTVTTPAPHLTFAKYINLSGLPAGKYEAVIEAMDVVTSKLVRRQASLVITQ